MTYDPLNQNHPGPLDPVEPQECQAGEQGERLPLFWYRPRSDGGYEGPIHNDRIEGVRKQSGVWGPLYPGFATLPKPLSDLRYHGEFIRGWNQCLREVIVSAAAPAAGDAQDAARYRWLTKHAYIGECYTHAGVVLKVNCDRNVPGHVGIDSSVDAAIDAAIADEQRQEG